MTQFNTPSAGDFARGRVTNLDQSEVQRQSLYDSLLYPTAGSQLLSFFSQPIGAGITTAPGATVGTVKTKSDTNLQLANQLPSGKEFQVQSIEVFFWPGATATTNTFTPWVSGSFAAVAATASLQATDDVVTFYTSGLLTFSVLDKPYVEESPLIKFPPQVALAGDFAVSSNSATTAINAIQLPRAVGRPYIFKIPFTIQPAQNFAVNLTWPGVVATPSGFNGRVVVVLDGFFMRATQ